MDIVYRGGETCDITGECFDLKKLSDALCQKIIDDIKKRGFDEKEFSDFDYDDASPFWYEDYRYKGLLFQRRIHYPLAARYYQIVMIFNGDKKGKDAINRD